MNGLSDSTLDSSSQASCEKCNNDANIAMIESSLMNGGRSLNAIWNLPFKSQEKLILSYIGSQLNFNGNFTEARRVTNEKLQRMTGLSRATLWRHINSLEKNGYLIRTPDTIKGNTYRLTPKLFHEYKTYLQNIMESRNEISQNVCDLRERRGLSQRETGAVSERDTNAPSSSLNNPSLINNGENPIGPPPNVYSDINKIDHDKKDRTKKTSSKKAYQFDEIDLILSKRWPNHNGVKRDDMKWANEFRLIREKENLSIEGLTFICEWIWENDFWRSVILSPMALRKVSKSSDVSKLTAVRGQINRQRNRS